MLNTVGQWWRGTGRTLGRTLRSRVTLPAVGQVPSEVLQALREFHPDLDTYVLPDGRVWLLKYEPGQPRIREGQKLLQQAKELDEYSDLEAAHLMAEGWSLLGELSYHEGTSVGAMLQHAQMTLYATAPQIEADQRRRKLMADGTTGREAAAALMLDRVQAFAKTDHARAFRGRKLFSTSFRSADR